MATRKPTTSPIIHLCRRKTLRMLLTRSGNASSDGGSDRRLFSEDDASPDRIFSDGDSPDKKEVVVRNKLKDLFVSSPENSSAGGSIGSAVRRIQPLTATLLKITKYFLFNSSNISCRRKPSLERGAGKRLQIVNSQNKKKCLRCNTLYEDEDNSPIACSFHGHTNGDKGLFSLAPPHQGIDGEWSNGSGVIVYKWNDKDKRPNTGRKKTGKRDGVVVLSMMTMLHLVGKDGMSHMMMVLHYTKSYVITFI
uniref:Uncharacterized protein n=1 Tax=Nicotiana tabacum TaxID=4097 RepID=A0A1S4D190_TOBAC|nr:PREDICTED: uncharacterized protein LOC107824864 [Nicotiana tabacum]